MKEEKSLRLMILPPLPLSFSSFPASIGTIYELFLRETFRLSYPFFSLSLFLLNKYLSFDFLFLRFSLSLSLSRKWTQEKSTHVYTRFESFLDIHFVQLRDAHDFHEKTRLGGGRIRRRITTHYSLQRIC